VLTHVGSAVVLVLAGFIVIRRTIGGPGARRPLKSQARCSSLPLGFGSYSGHCARMDHAATDGRGPSPCHRAGAMSLTTFVMVYASTQGIIAAGLLVTAGMALGMTLTIALFALGASCYVTASWL